MLHYRLSHNVPRRSGGFTLVELLVVITIIGILVGMLLPAVNSARESGRNAQCKNNLKQMGMACLAHDEEQGFYPTGGWGYSWVGDPDCGFGSQQPGGWLYNILPHTDLANLHDQQFTVNGTAISGKTIPGVANSTKAQAMQLMIGTALPFANCPTRRRPAVLVSSGGSINNANGGVTESGNPVARSDYAANCGDGVTNQLGGPINSNGPGPAKGADTRSNGTLTSNAGSLQNNYFGTRLTTNLVLTSSTGFTGVSYEQSTIRKDDITDGLSQTLLLGEKYIGANFYGMGTLGSGDSANLYAGFGSDTFRASGGPAPPPGYGWPAGVSADTPKQDRPGPSDDTLGFGSAHVNGANFVLCDGSAITISYSVDGQTFCWLSTRTERLQLQPNSNSYTAVPAPVDMSKLGNFGG